MNAENQEAGQAQEELLSEPLKGFDYEEIDRSRIRLAEYNPRKISKAARAKLDNSLESFGCVELLVWNKRTGNLVSGHQRISLLDERHEGEEYKVATAVVDLSPRDEKALNVQLNNRFVQGEFSRELMSEFLRDAERPSLADMGFSKLELEMTIGVMPELKGIIEEELAASAEAEAELQEIKRRKKEHKKNSDASTWSDTGYYIVVAADSVEEKRRTLRAAGQSETAEHVLISKLTEALDPDCVPPEGEAESDEQDTAPTL